MKILLISIGTRGDIEPFLAQAELLSSHGHEITCLFPEQFRLLTEGLGFTFRGLDERFLELLDSSSGKSVMGGGGGFIKKSLSFFRLIRDSFQIQGNLIRQQKEAIAEIQPDQVLFHSKAIYCTLPAIALPEKYVMLTPVPCLVHPSPDFPHLGLSKWKPFSPKWNLRTYDWINGLRYLSFRKFLKPHFSDFPGVDFSNTSIKEFEMFGLKTIYQISPVLFPKPENWPSNAYITGFLTRNQTKDYIPESELTEWLEKFPKAILLTFGSMTNPKPKEYSKIILGLLEKMGIPTLVNLSWGGLEKIEGTSERIFYINQIPYDWVLPKLYGIIHHGGSGTTHSAAKSGAVQLIVPQCCPK